MAVFTPVTLDEVNALLAEYGHGPCQQLVPATSGIENTTYLLTTQSANNTAATELVLTIFETLKPADVEFYAQLLSFLITQSLPVPNPLKHPQLGYQGSLHHKPSLLMTKLDGQHLTQPKDIHAEQISVFLALLHKCTATYPLQRPNTRDFLWLKRQSQQTVTLTHDEALLCNQSIQQLDAAFAEIMQLPMTLIHGDLFVDNALFVNDQLRGVIDFYNAHTGPALWDLAIAVLAWCSDTQGQLNQSRMQLMLTTYQRVRDISSAEQKHWINLLRYAALRFWISRLLFWQRHAQNLPSMSTERTVDLQQQKNPLQFKRLLQTLIEK
jgi:homoserine kinase type II